MLLENNRQNLSRTQNVYALHPFIPYPESSPNNNLCKEALGIKTFTDTLFLEHFSYYKKIIWTQCRKLRRQLRINHHHLTEHKLHFGISSSHFSYAHILF